MLEDAPETVDAAFHGKVGRDARSGRTAKGLRSIAVERQLFHAVRHPIHVTFLYEKTCFLMQDGVRNAGVLR